jgi:hypothetical protein
MSFQPPCTAVADIATAGLIRQSIPKTMNSNITDNGTPNIHIITIRVINQLLNRCWSRNMTRGSDISAADSGTFSSFHATARAK